MAVAQLLVLLVLPVTHHAATARAWAEQASHAYAAGDAEHTETPRSDRGHDEAACHICRIADIRSITPGGADDLPGSAAGAVARLPELDERRGTTSQYFPQGPRPPPSA